MTKVKKAKSKSRKTFSWWLALDPCIGATVRRKRKIRGQIAPQEVVSSSTLQSEKVRKSMELLASRIRKAQNKFAFTNEEMLAWYIFVIGLFRADHLWDQTLPSYSELLDDYMRSKASPGGPSSEAEAERAGTPPRGP